MALNTKIKLRLRTNAPALSFFSTEALEALESSFHVVTPDGTRLVHYGDIPPSDTGLPWQPTLSDGVTPNGQVKRFLGGRWQ